MRGAALELDRRSIERHDFRQTRRGYDPDEVDAHLAELSAAVEEMRNTFASGASSGLAGVAAEQVRVIVEAAERSAQEIEANARAEADRATGEAKREAEQERNSARSEAQRTRATATAAAQEMRERAESDAATHLAKVQEATAGMTQRAQTVENDLNGLVDELRGTISALVESVRNNAGSLESELESIKSGLADVRAAAPEPVPEPEYEPEPHLESEVEPEPEPEPGPVAVSAPDEPEFKDEPAEVDAGSDPTDEGTSDEGYQEEPAAVKSSDGAEGARLIALNMALNGTPRHETDRYLEENFDLDDRAMILDEVYARVGG